MASALFVLVFPVVLVQVGYMYTEIPVMVCSVVAVDLWRRGRVDAAVALWCIALFIKLTAVALALSQGAARAAGDIDAGKAKSAPCAACHGPEGNTPIQPIPRSWT